ncbi:GNAT family N-acetyltransferase [Flavilitoribacter nigricans]|uniref:N-acetyltransferase domain-containing protein n=1 Tax=Flavilitoribacter nigricans (strain ATCC 23147 / DSM 23189 / NBRC 102662 / NCIMB 1420 / SS-2) TaxID=1122177 RepID=A0A2D0NJG3_FLAN2|nr:GNAT family protein [Flavilitoribacter nigricans]PHN07873.1 hypothetical protein CRP01_03735 [Flavilitoribacter nigricans DSM 23189 = NBRC 102662]
MLLSGNFTLETLRLRLGMPAPEDLPFIFSASRYPGFTDGMLWYPPENMEELEEPLQRAISAWERGEAYAFTIADKHTSDFYGRISIRPTSEAGGWNIGFWTHPDHQGKGIMSEAVGAVIEFGFTQLQAREIEACHAIWNKASERVLQKNGMRLVRYIEKGFKKHGKWVDENLLAISREEWEGRQA